MFFIFAFALLVTMCFPVAIHGLVYDFRSILLTVGSLYGGFPVTCGLYVVLLAVRYAMGSPTEGLYACALLPTLLMVWGALRIYSSLTLSRKIMLAVVLSTLIKLVTFVCYLTYTDNLKLMWVRPVSTLETYMLQALIAGICIYAFEFLHRYSQMREEMFRSEKIKIVSEMAASVAHEIRNPLTAVRGFIQLFAVENLDPQRKQFYQQICLEELDRAQLIITDYLALAKPDPEVIESINLHEELAYIANVLTTFAIYNNIQILGIEAAEKPLMIRGDRHKFRQALVNIGKNAIEAMADGGTLGLKAFPLKDQAAVYISDTGTGMTDEQLNRLGTPYYSTKDKGTGLGTMVSFGIIRKMNGKIEIKSDVGRGTRYTILFPQD